VSTSQAQSEDPATDEGITVPCIAAAEGIALGTIHFLRLDAQFVSDPSRVVSIDELHRAVDLTHDQLESFQRRIHSRIEESVAQVFRAHIAILHDKDLMDWIESGIRSGRPAEAVIREAYGHHIELFSRSPVARLREKVQDLQDIANRLIRNLFGGGQVGGGLHGRIVIAHELYPSELLRLVAQDAAGAILIGGGTTAHINVLARSLQLPLVVCDAAAEAQFREGQPVLVDGGRGLLMVADDPAVLTRCSQRGMPPVGQLLPLTPTTATADGHRIRLLVNVGLLSEAQLANELGADGIGLYRSEIQFLLRDEPPQEDEQTAIYRRLLDLAPHGVAVVRLLDLGGDKIAAYFPHDIGPNPSLGLRGIRFSFRHPEILSCQVRAILRAGHGRQLRILVPMVSSIDSFMTVRDVIATCSASLAAAGIPHNDKPSLGAMIELPSAVLQAQEIAAASDFLAIGTNDLVQYILAVDRNDDRVADWYIPWHPAVLRALRMIVNAAAATGRPLSICGDIACDPVLLPLLIGLGITAISVPPRTLHRVQQSIATLRYDDAVTRTTRVLLCTTIAEVEEILGIPQARRRHGGLLRSA
jgi:phosphotransferase system, enzyme I, PtsP